MAQFPSAHELKVAVELSPVVVRPGHTLVVGCPGRINPQEAARLKERLQASLPGVGVVILPEVSQLLVYEPADGQE